MDLVRTMCWWMGYHNGGPRPASILSNSPTRNVPTILNMCCTKLSINKIGLNTSTGDLVLISSRIGSLQNNVHFCLISFRCSLLWVHLRVRSRIQKSVHSKSRGRRAHTQSHENCVFHIHAKPWWYYSEYHMLHTWHTSLRKAVISGIIL